MVSSFNLNVAPINLRSDFCTVEPFPDTLASWSGSEFDLNTLQDICQVDPATLLIPYDEYGFAYGRVPSSACAVFNPVEAVPKLPDSINAWQSIPSNPNPTFYYSDDEPFLDVAHPQPQQLQQQS